MDEEETIITIYSEVFGGREYDEKPGSVVIKLTRDDLDRIKHLTKLVVDENLDSITYDFQCGWYDARPAFSFGELGKKFRILYDIYDSTGDFDNMSEEKDPNAKFEYECLGSHEMVIMENGFFCRAWAKHSDHAFSSCISTVYATEVALNDPDDTPREKYYFYGNDPIPTMEDIPKLINDPKLILRTYARERLKRGA